MERGERNSKKKKKKKKKKKREEFQFNDRMNFCRNRFLEKAPGKIPGCSAY